MLKKIIMSLSAVMFLLGTGTAFAVDANSVHITNGKTTKAEVLELFGEPKEMSTNLYGKEVYRYMDRSRLDITFDNDVVWSSIDDSP